ncbi:MAG: hypothetical protein AAGK97_15395, partial [Bacteroidota bacterium]
QSANSTISALQEKIANLETHHQLSNEEIKENGNSTSAPHRTLLLGDTNLTHVKTTDLGNDCNVRTIKDADINLLRSWISNQLNWIPDSCILFGGISDILDGKSPSEIVDDISLLVSDLKSKNPEMNLYICKLIPTLQSDELQAKINELNDEIEKCCQTNEINILNANLPFKLMTNDIDEMCYDIGDESSENSGIFLNRFGAIRLLDWIAKKCPTFKLNEDWANIMRGRDFVPRGRKANGDKQISSGQMLNRGDKNGFLSPTLNKPRQADQNFYHNRIKHHNNQQYPAHQARQNSRYQENQYHHHRRNLHQQNQLQSNGRLGCFNCGEYNHHQSNCRFDHKIQCSSCLAYGHKSRLCSLYTR